MNQQTKGEMKMETKQSIQMEIHDTIIHLCKEIQDAGYGPLEKAELVKATAQLIESTKDRGIV